MNKRLQHFHNGGLFFIPLIFTVLGGAVGGAIGGGAIAGIGISAMFGMSGTAIGSMLGMMAGSVLGNMLFPADDETKWPELDEYPIQKSTNGPPVQVVLGTRAVAGNVIWEGEVQAYEVEHQAGGKGGDTFGKGGGIEETRYRQSFLIGICEGPASVLRISANGKEIWPDPTSGLELYIRTYKGESADVTIFQGVDNQGITDLTGENYGQWPHDCCAFFKDYELGNFKTKPNFVFEVGPYLTDYFGLITDYTNGHVVARSTLADGIDTSWGTNGFWSYVDPVTGDSPFRAYDILELPDGRLLVATDGFAIKSNDAASKEIAWLVMLNLRDGSIDTSWGDNGFFAFPFLANPMASVYRILQDADGNFHVFGHSQTYPYFVLSEDGTTVLRQMAATSTANDIHYDARWVDDKKTQIITVGNPRTVAGSSINMIMIDAASSAVDSSWDGNIGIPGYAAFTSSPLFAVRPVSDGLIIYSGANFVDPTLYKIAADGSGLDASWASGGGYTAGRMLTNPSFKCIAENNDEVFFISYTYSAPQWTVHFTHLDAGGSLVDNYAQSVASEGYYVGIQLINDKLILCNKAGFQIWTIDLTLEDTVAIGGVDVCTFAIPDRSNGLDYNFATMCRDVLTNSQWGVGLDVDTQLNNATFNSAEDYCWDQGLLGSIVIDEQQSWRDWLDYICSHFGGYWFESGGQICLGVYRDSEPAANLDEADGDFAIADGKDPPPPIKVRQREYSETLNRILVTWTDRDNDYQKGGPVPANDETDQRISGQIRSRTYDLRGICDADLAQRTAYRLLIDAMYRFKTYNFPVPYKWMLLEPGDVITISGRPKIVNARVRIFKVAEEARGRGLDIVAVEDISGLYPDIAFGVQGSLKTALPTISIYSGSVNFREDVATNQLYLSITPGGAYTNGWYIYRSYDDATYDLIGRCGIGGVTGGSANSAGTISGSLAAHGSTTWAPDESVLVNIGTVTDLHTDITDAQFWGDLRLARIGSEIIAFLDAVETATPGVWLISNLRRGCFGTEALAHTAGEAFCTLDSNFLYRFNEADIGRTLYFKALTYYGDITQNIASVSSFSVTVQGYYKRPAAASLLRLTSDQNDGGSGEYSGSSFSLYWNLGSRVSGYNYGGYDVSGGGVPYANYTADDDLEAVVLRFEQADETAIGEREISVGESATITKATDLGGNNPARVMVVPRRVYESRLQNVLLVDDGT